MATVETPRRGVFTMLKWKSGALGLIINQYESISTISFCRAGATAFSWRPRFYAHIIRNNALARRDREKRTFTFHNHLIDTKRGDPIDRPNIILADGDLLSDFDRL
jgi:hypothetical protein